MLQSIGSEAASIARFPTFRTYASISNVFPNFVRKPNDSCTNNKRRVWLQYGYFRVSEITMRNSIVINGFFVLYMNIAKMFCCLCSLVNCISFEIVFRMFCIHEVLDLNGLNYVF